MKIAGYEVHPAAELFEMLDEVSLQRLADDIKSYGQKVPIVLVDGKVLDGRNRLLACKKAGVEPRFVSHDGSNPWRAAWSLNKERRHITDMVRLGLKADRMIRGSDDWESKQARAKEEANAKRTGRPNKGTEKSPPAHAGRLSPDRSEASRANEATSRVAAEAGVSRAGVERARQLVKAATRSGADDLVKAVERGEVEGQKALREVKREEKHAAIAEQSLSMPAVGTVQRCPVVYADPPWQYGNTAGASAAADHYPTMPLADICAMDVPATKDAVLFLWATSPLLPEAFEVIRAWGFTYKASMVWDKGSGTGNWVLNAHELLLIAVRGDIPCPAPSNRPVSVVRTPVGRHSEKPEAFAAAIERMFPGLPKVELFARRTRDGWTAWGNQAA